MCRRYHGIKRKRILGEIMNTELITGIALGICFVAFIGFAIYKEKQIHKNKPTFKKDIK